MMRARRETTKPTFFRKTTACLVNAAMIVSLTPMVAWGTTASGVAYVDANGNPQTPVSATEVSDTDTTWGDDGNDGWYVVNSNVTIGSAGTPQRVTVNGHVHLILADECNLTVNGGIQVQDNDNNPSTNSLTIYGQSTAESTMGKLIAKGDSGNAGIGGNGNSSGSGGSGGTIAIHGGTVEVTGGSDGAAGIGGGYGEGDGSSGGSGGTITIYGGEVTASGGTDAAGIGGGFGKCVVTAPYVPVKADGGSGGTITIYGGEVTAKGGSRGAGIGGGCGSGAGIGGSGGNVTINGGTVRATGGDYASGIGGGSCGSSGGITISGGTVIAMASGDNNGAGIGGGSIGDGENITIIGGTVIATSTNGAGIGGGYKPGGAVHGTFSTTNNGSPGNAVIFAKSVGDNSEEKKASWSGVIFEGVAINKDSSNNVTVTGGTGQVCGSNVAPSESFEVPSGSTLTVPSGSTLTIASGKTLTNNGTVYVDGKLTHTDAINGSGAVYYLLTLDGATATGVTTTPNSKTYGTADSEITLTRDTAPTGHSFGSWSVTSGSVTVGEDNKFTMPSSAVAISAQWKANEYTIALEANGGTINSGNVTSYTYGVGATLPTDVTKAGYSFAGWYDNASFTGNPVTAISTTDTEGKVYWAKWSAIYTPPATPVASTECSKAISALPDLDALTLSSGEDIKAARAAYEALTDYQKRFVPANTLAKLVAAEERYENLVAVAPVEAALSALPAPSEMKAKNAKKAVKEAKRVLKQLAGLTDAQRELVDEQLVAHAVAVIAQAEKLIARADKKAVKRVKDKAFSVIAGKSKSITFKTEESAAGTQVIYKMTKGSKYITVTKSGKVTAKKGMTAGKSYNAKIKVICGDAHRYVKAVVRVR